MQMDTDPGPARAVAGAACAAAVGMRETKFWNLLDRDLLSLAQTYGRAARLVYAAQVQLAGEINTRNLAGSHGCTSTAALLRHALTISAPDARGGWRRWPRCCRSNMRPGSGTPNPRCRCSARRRLFIGALLFVTAGIMSPFALILGWYENSALTWGIVSAEIIGFAVLLKSRLMWGRISVARTAFISGQMDVIDTPRT